MADSHTSKAEDLPVVMPLPDSTITAATPPQMSQADSGVTTFDPLRNPLNTKNEFHFFPKLPKELRLTIWEMALPPPRIFWLKMFVGMHHCKGKEWSAQFMYMFSPAPVPILLQICQEARQEGLRFYDMVPVRGIATEDRYRCVGCSGATTSKQCFVDFSRDYFKYPLRETFDCHSFKWIFERAERVVVPETEWRWGDEGEVELSKNFPSLKELTVYAASYMARSGHARDNRRPENLQLIPIDPGDEDYFEPCSLVDRYEIYPDEESDDEEDRWDEDGLIFKPGRGDCIEDDFVCRKTELPDEKRPILNFARLENIKEFTETELTKIKQKLRMKRMKKARLELIMTRIIDDPDEHFEDMPELAKFDAGADDYDGADGDGENDNGDDEEDEDDEISDEEEDEEDNNEDEEEELDPEETEDISSPHLNEQSL